MSDSISPVAKHSAPDHDPKKCIDCRRAIAKRLRRAELERRWGKR